MGEKRIPNNALATTRERVAHSASCHRILVFATSATRSTCATQFRRLIDPTRPGQSTRPEQPVALRRQFFASALIFAQ